jgi:hypothetical protein
VAPLVRAVGSIGVAAVVVIDAPLGRDATRILEVAEGPFGAAPWAALRNDAVVALRQCVRNRRRGDERTIATLASTAVGGRMPNDAPRAVLRLRART